MSPRPSTLLCLMLCLGQMIHTQEGALPKPSLRAEPGSVIPRGQPVTFVCNSSLSAKLFRLEKDGRCARPDNKNVSQGGEKEARFLILMVSENSTGTYRCLYHQGSNWSERSEPLQLQVTEEDVSTRQSGAPGVLSSTLSSTRSFIPTSTPITHTKIHSSAGDTRNQSPDSTIQGLSNKYVYILVGTLVAFLLCLLLLVRLFALRRCQRKHTSPHSKGDEQRPKERLTPTDDITKSTPEEATAYALPEKKRELQSPSPAVGDTQEVTYAELDQRALTLRAAQAVSPQPKELTAAARKYAELPRR